MGLYFNINLDQKIRRLSQNIILWGEGCKQNTILPQTIVTFVVKSADLTVKAIRPSVILKNTTGTHKKKLKYTPLLQIPNLLQI